MMRTQVGWFTTQAVMFCVVLGVSLAPGGRVLAAAAPQHSRRVVVVDPGHGGKDPGTTGVTGDQEKNITLAVGREVAAYLARHDIETRLTRSADRFVSLEARAALANRLHADLLVSIHANSNPDHSIHGFTVFVAPSASARTQALARAEMKALIAAGFPSRGIHRRPYRVLVDSQGPATLIELGFMSNPAENARLCNAAVQKRYARAIGEGIVAGLKR